MLRALTIAILLLFAFLLMMPLSLSPAEAQQKPRQDPNAKPPEPKERFNGVVRVRRRDQGEAVEMNVAVVNWSIAGGTAVTALQVPPQSLVVAQLAAGKITTIIDGRRQERKEREFWTVPPDKQLGLETDDDSAIVQTIAISRR